MLNLVAEEEETLRTSGSWKAFVRISVCGLCCLDLLKSKVHLSSGKLGNILTCQARDGFVRR